jgi:hypothetical protein
VITDVIAVIIEAISYLCVAYVASVILDKLYGTACKFSFTAIAKMISVYVVALTYGLTALVTEMVKVVVIAIG